MIGVSTLFVVLGAVAPGPYSEENLNAVVAVAEAELQRLDGRCRPGEVPPGGDTEAEEAYMRMAEMRRMSAEHFPYLHYGVEGQKEHSEDIHKAASFYEQAFLCHPEWEQRRYLNQAIAMIERRRKEIAEKERRATAEDYTKLGADEERLRGHLRALTPPPPRDPVPCDEARCPKGAGAEASTPARGYRKRLMDLFALRVELGPSIVMTLDESAADELSHPRAFVFSVSPGVRLLAGARRRHVFGLGFRYTLLAFREEDSRDRVSQMAARFEYGVRLHEEWFSVHGSFEPGIQSHAKHDYFGHVQLGGSGSLCTWGEAICLRVSGSRSVVPAKDSFLRVGTVTFGLDVFRIVDNLIRQTEVAP